jgi:hypothetical protein
VHRDIIKKNNNNNNLLRESVILIFSGGKLEHTVFWDGTPCCRVEIVSASEKPAASIFTVFMVALSHLEMFVNLYQIIRHHFSRINLTRDRSKRKLKTTVEPHGFDPTSSLITTFKSRKIRLAGQVMLDKKIPF